MIYIYILYIFNELYSHYSFKKIRTLKIYWTYRKLTIVTMVNDSKQVKSGLNLGTHRALGFGPIPPKKLSPSTFNCVKVPGDARLISGPLFRWSRPSKPFLDATIVFHWFMRTLCGELSSSAPWPLSNLDNRNSLQLLGKL